MTTCSGQTYSTAHNDSIVVLCLDPNAIIAFASDPRLRRTISVASWDEASRLAESFQHAMCQYETARRRAAALVDGYALIGGPAFADGTTAETLARFAGRPGRVVPREVPRRAVRLVAALLAVLCASACARVNPNAPTDINAGTAPAVAVAPPEVPRDPRVGFPVDLSPIGLDAIGYVCATQPRYYCDATGATCWSEPDHYVSFATCPAEPIQ